MLSVLLLLLYVHTLNARHYIPVTKEIWTKWAEAVGISRHSLTAGTANNYCNDIYGQHLASFSNNDEYQQMISVADKLKWKLYYIGLKKLDSKWLFIDGSDCISDDYLCVSQWKEDEPNNRDGLETCTEIWAKKINDVKCDMNYMGHEGFICNGPINATLTAEKDLFNEDSTLSEVWIIIIIVIFVFAISIGCVLYWYLRIKKKQIRNDHELYLDNVPIECRIIPGLQRMDEKDLENYIVNNPKYIIPFIKQWKTEPQRRDGSDTITNRTSSESNDLSETHTNSWPYSHHGSRSHGISGEKRE